MAFIARSIAVARTDRNSLTLCYPQRFSFAAWQCARRAGGGQQRMTVSGTDGDSTPRGGSLLSLAPRKPARRAPALNPMLAALARTPEPPAERPQAPLPEEDTATKAEASVESVAAEEPAAVEESKVEDAPTEEVGAEDVPAGSAPKTELSPAAETSETAKGLVARLRRQFVEGLPDGRAGEVKTSTKTAEPNATPRRSALDEVRFRLSEFRTEILVRAAGRGKPSRRE
ncbi:MAG: hypothetical protein J0I06_22325 [Planctomycetes bacterium]|nr:hypothetical protein [Hyphomicrobiales bacterium]MBN9121841.1 hypothetical protein [Planctomycetota bacterium]